MVDLTAATLREWRETPFRWGTADCVMSVCAYAARLAGIDPGRAYRGTYDGPDAAQAIIARHGGFAELMADLFGAAGFVVVAAPRRGDVVAVRAGGALLAGLWTGARVAMRREGRGTLEVLPRFVEVLGAWRWEA